MHNFITILNNSKQNKVINIARIIRFKVLKGDIQKHCREILIQTIDREKHIKAIIKRVFERGNEMQKKKLFVLWS